MAELWKQAFAQRVQRIGHEVAVAEHDAFRAAGGAAGVEDAGEVGGDAHRIRNWLASCSSDLVAFHSGRHVAVVGIDQLQAGNRFRQSGARRCERLVDDQDVGAAIAHARLRFQAGSIGC